MAIAWQIDDALKLIRAIQTPSRKYGYHLALGGSVLNHGSSQKDLDLYFLPMNNTKLKEDPQGLVTWLKSMWGKSVPIGKDYEDMVKFDPGFYRPDQEIRVDPDRGPYFQVVKVPSFVVSQSSGVYKYKLKFLRPGGDRIDVFVC